LYTLSNRQREKSKCYRCNACTRESLTFFQPSCVFHGWRCGVIMCVRILYYFKMGYNRTHVWHLMGANQPGDRGCPLKKGTIGSYLSQIRHRVALVGLRKMLQVRLSGPCQADESFVRCQRKHNVGRINPGRKHTLVILIYVFFALSGNVGVIVEYPLSIHCVYHPLNLSSHVIMRSWVFGILFRNTWWLFEFLIGKLRLCGLSFITFVMRVSKSPRTRGRDIISSGQTDGDI